MRVFLKGVSLTALAVGGAWGAPSAAQENVGATAAPFAGITSADAAYAAPQDAEQERTETLAEAQESADAGSSLAPVEAGEAVADPKGGAITVTGSRMSGGDTTSRTQVITREDIRRRGVTTVEELLRTMPENLATIGAITNNRVRGPLRNREAAVSQLGSFGVSAANLGGSGAGNTLVLVNGRRMAGAAGIEDGFVNLNDIPLAAVDRVEIDTSGASAVYGADAMGGVINFILKKDFIGTTVTGGYEKSNNGADQRRISAFSGYAWGTGSISGTASYRERDPVVNRKTGFVTQNYSDYFNGDPYYDRRSFSNGGQPGLIDRTQYEYDDNWNVTEIPMAWTLPTGFVGRPTVDDFIVVGPEVRRDFVPPYGGMNSKSLSFSANFEQKLTDRLTLNASGLFTRNRNFQDAAPPTGIGLSLAPGQYYNPFPAYPFDDWTPGPTVYYFPDYEVADGEVTYGRISNVTRAWTANASLKYDVNRSTAIELLYTRSRTSSKARSANFSSLVSLQEDSASASGVRCYNFFVANPSSYRGADFDGYVDAFNRQCEALTSSDPNIAFNPWKSTAAGGGSSISNFFWQDASEQRGSTLQNVEARMRGNLINLPGGPIRYAVGAEYNTDGVNSREVQGRTGTPISQDRYAVFGEVSLPLVGGDFTLPLVHRLTLDLAARRDTYKTDGAVGTVGNVPYEDGVDLVYAKNTFSRTTPTIGLRWEPVEELVLRGRLSTGFKAPPFTQLFNYAGTTTNTSTVYADPYYDCRAQGDCNVDYGGTFYGYYVPRVTAPNPDLKPQTSKQLMLNALWQPQGALRGLQLEVTYNRTRIKNSYASTRDLSNFLSVEEQYALEEFYPRDANGKITAANVMTFNIGGSTYSSITYGARYIVSTGIGSFEPSVTYMRNLKSEYTPFDNGRTFSTLGRLQGTDRYKITGQLNWYYDDISVTLLGYYTPSYLNDYEMITAAGVVVTPDLIKSVPSYTTFDLTSTWKVNNSLRVNFAARNMFDAKPPFVVVGDVPYDAARFDVAGRTLSLEVQYAF